METVPVVKHIIRNSASLTEEGHKQPQLKPQISALYGNAYEKKSFVLFFFSSLRLLRSAPIKLSFNSKSCKAKQPELCCRLFEVILFTKW